MRLLWLSTGVFQWKKYLTDKKFGIKEFNLLIMAKIKFRQFKSSSGMPMRQLKTLEALGIRGINQVVELEETPQIIGMYNKVKHLVKIEK